MNLRENRVGGGIWTGLKGGNRRGKHIYIFEKLCMCVCTEKAVRCHRARVIYSSEPPDMRAGNQTQVLCKAVYTFNH